MVIKVPVNMEGVQAASKLQSEGVRICLTACYASHQALIPDLSGAQLQLRETDVWSVEEHAALKEAFEFLQSLQQVQRMAQDTITSDMQLSQALKDRLCRATSCTDFDAVEAHLAAISATITALFQEKIGVFATEI